MFDTSQLVQLHHDALVWPVVEADGAEPELDVVGLDAQCELVDPKQLGPIARNERREIDRYYIINTTVCELRANHDAPD